MMKAVDATAVWAVATNFPGTDSSVVVIACFGFICLSPAIFEVVNERKWPLMYAICSFQRLKDLSCID